MIAHHAAAFEDVDIVNAPRLEDALGGLRAGVAAGRRHLTILGDHAFDVQRRQARDRQGGDQKKEIHGFVWWSVV